MSTTYGLYIASDGCHCVFYCAATAFSVDLATSFHFCMIEIEEIKDSWNCLGQTNVYRIYQALIVPPGRDVEHC